MTAERKRRRFSLRLPTSRLGKVLLALAAVPAFCLAWFLLNRVTAPSRAVCVFHETQTYANADDPTDDLLRIGIYNIAHGRGWGSENWTDETPDDRNKRLAEIARFLKQARLDVVILNEVDFDSSWSFRVNQAEVIARLAGFPHRLEQRNVDASLPGYRWRFGNAILSKHTISKARLVDLPDYSFWETFVAGKKRAAECTLTLADGNTVRVLPVHLSHRSAQLRLESAKVLAELPRGDNDIVIAAGDFNSTLAGFPEASGEAVTYLVGPAGFRTLPTTPPANTDLTFSSTEPRMVIDWLMVSGPGEWIAREVYPLTLSDHRPVVATLRFGMISDTSDGE